MATIAANLLSIDGSKTDLAENLTTKGVNAADTETLAALVGKVLDVPTGTDTSDATAAAGDIRTGKSAYGSAGTKLDGSLIPLDTSDADAVADDIATGKTAYVNGEKLTGMLVPANPLYPSTELNANPVISISCGTAVAAI